METLLEKCSVCQKGSVTKVTSQSILFWLELIFGILFAITIIGIIFGGPLLYFAYKECQKKKAKCNNCQSVFELKLSGISAKEEFYQLHAAKNYNTKHDKQTYSLGEWEHIAKTGETYIEQVKRTQELPITKFDEPQFILAKDEKAVFFSIAILNEERMIREYKAGHAGFRIAKGVWAGGTKGHAESHGEIREIDRGKLLLTTQRILFNGQFKNYDIRLKDINYLSLLSNAIEIGKKGRQKTMVFTVMEPEKWHTFTQTAVQKITGG